MFFHSTLISDILGFFFFVVFFFTVIHQNTDLIDMLQHALPFQKRGIEFLINKNGGMLGDEMGLGKTFQALATIESKHFLRILIVCPSSLKQNWRNEILRWISGSAHIQVLNASTKFNVVPLMDDNEVQQFFVIVNYELLKKWSMWIQKQQFCAAIFDESHYLKNKKATRTKMALKIAKNIKFRILLSGTPISNRPYELWPQLCIVRPDLYNNRTFWRFVRRYCNAKQGPFGWDFSGATNLKELNHEIQHLMIRRRKQDVLQEFPSKQTKITYFTMPERKKYKKLLSLYYNAPSEDKIGLIHQIRQEISLCKREHFCKWVSDCFLAKNKKLVIFTDYRDSASFLYKRFASVAVLLTGDTPSDIRQGLVTKFQEEKKIQLFIGNIRAAGVGLTLTSASDVAFFEVCWSPSNMMQAEDRVHRIGQRHKVTVHYYLDPNTFEMAMLKTIEAKKKMSKKVIDGDSIIAINTMNQYLSTMKFE